MSSVAMNSYPLPTEYLDTSGILQNLFSPRRWFSSISEMVKM